MPKRIARTLRNNARKAKRARRAIIKDDLRGFNRGQIKDEQITHALKKADELLPKKLLNTRTIKNASKESRFLSHVAFLRNLHKAHAEKPGQISIKLADAESKEYVRNRYDYERGERKAKRRAVEDLKRKIMRAVEKQKQGNN